MASYACKLGFIISIVSRIVKARQSREDPEKILQVENRDYSSEEEKAWDTTSLKEELGKEVSA